jgi:large subunit ribosomal protein L25
MTKHAQLAAQSRDIVGNKVRVLRREGSVPAVVYSKVVSSTPIQINALEFVKVFKQTGKTDVIDLNIDGKIQPCLIQAMDIHPFKHTIRHIDFLAVDLKKKITASVPVITSGDAPGVKEVGGVVNIALNQIEIEALPDDIPENITIDISSLIDFTHSIYISDIKLPKDAKYKIISDSELLVVNLAHQSQEEEKETPVTEVETGVAKDTK